MAIFKADSEYLRLPSKLKVAYFITYLILVSTFVIFLLLFSMNKSRRTNEASLQKVVSFAKGFSKHPHIFPIFKVVSEYSRLPFKLTVDYFTLYWILVSTFVIFLPFFYMNKRRCTDEAENGSFIRMCTFSSVNRNESTDHQYVISSKKSPGHHISSLSVSTLEAHFIYLCFSLNDRLLVISLVISRLVSL